jgi:DNA mismatch repair protein MutS
MGGRLLRQWLLSPLRDPAAISYRLDAVEVAVRDGRGRARLREALDGVRDIERLAGRAAAGLATPRELGALGDSLLRLPACQALSTAARPCRTADLRRARGRGGSLICWPTCRPSWPGARRSAPGAGEGGVIRRGYDTELDELRSLRDGGRQYIAALQQRERDRTGITSLKVGFNKVFGYYLEITNAHAAKVPPDYERRQTLAGAERYVTPELKEYESKVLGAEERIAVREAELSGAPRGGRQGVGGSSARRGSARLDVDLADRAAGRYARRRCTTGSTWCCVSRHPVSSG